jgi:purine-cytosine permease-like protein
MSTGTDPGERTFGFLDHAALWGNLGLTFYIMPFGSFLVPSLSLTWAFAAVLVAAVLAALLIAFVARIAAREGLSSAALLESLFSPRSRPAVSLLLATRNVAFTALALAVIADSAALVSDRALGAGLRSLWVVAFAGLGFALLLAGPHFVVRKVLKRAVLWLAVIIAAAVTISAYREFGIPAYLQRPSVGGWPSFWQAVDVMLIVPLLWLPVVADYARHGRSPHMAFSGTFAGLAAATVWMGCLGIVYLPAVETGDIAGFVAAMRLGVGALLLLVVLQLDEVFVNMHSGGVAALALGRRWRPVIAVAPAVLAVALALPPGALRLEATFLLIGSAFVPLFAVLVADRGFGVSEARPLPVYALIAWVMGFAAYHWIAPPDVGWWQNVGRWLFADRLGLPYPLSDEVTWLGAAIPSFLLAFVLYPLLNSIAAVLDPARLARRRDTA